MEVARREAAVPNENFLVHNNQLINPPFNGGL